MPTKTQTPPSSQVPAVRSNDLLAVAKRVDEIASGAMALFQQAGDFASEIQVAQTMGEMRLALTPEVMQPIMELADTDLGFRTDHDPHLINSKTGRPNEPYPVEVVRDVLIEARLRGYHAVGNEFNIISGRFYATRNGLKRKCETFPGVTGLKISLGVPKLVGDKGALCPVKASWNTNGVADSIEAEIPVKVNSFMGADAILGKAERKLYKRILDRLTGTNTPEGEVGDDIPVEGQVVTKGQPQANFGPETPAEPFQAPAASPAEQPQATAAQPSAEPAPEPGTRTPQQQIEAVITQAGHTFADLQSFCVKTNWMPGMANISTFADLTTSAANKMLNAQAGILSGIARRKGGAQ